MKKSLWILKTELTQNKLHFILIALIALALGIGVRLGILAERRVSELTTGVGWNADLVVLPKGISLADLKEELLTHQTRAFLPEALFDTTLEMAKGQFRATAVIAITDESGPHLFVKNSDEIIGLGWIKESAFIKNWQVQSKYSTPEWSNKVIAAFFASGPRIAMNKLKELIDKRTVGQAILIKDQLIHDEDTQKQVRNAMLVYSALLFALILLSFTSLLFWLKVRISNSMQVFKELGFPNSVTFVVLGGLFLLSVLVPVCVGFWISSFYTI